MKMDSPYPMLLIQGEEKMPMLGIKIAAEKQLLSAGSTLCEASDRLFKMYWVFNLCYEPSCDIFFNFLKSFHGIQYGNLSKSVMEFNATLAQYKQDLNN